MALLTVWLKWTEMDTQESKYSLGRVRYYGYSGQDVQNRQEAREAVQKRTFTRWINIHLKKCEPPVEVIDLFSDLQDGHVLMALLEQLSGCKMLYRFRPSTHRLFRVNNIAKVLNFLEDRNLKCKSIDASDVADGIPCAVLGMVWTVIVLFHIKKHTRNIRHILSTHSTRSIETNTDTLPISSSAKTCDWDSNTFPSKRKKSSAASKYRGTAIKTLLRWAQTCTSKYDVEVRDFGKSWRSGLAFLALIKSITPAIVDMRAAISKTPQENVEDAFRIAQSALGIPSLLDVEDVITSTPDEQSIITYVTYFLEYKQRLDELNGLELHTRSSGTSTTSPNVGCVSSPDPAHHSSVIEPTLFTPVKDDVQSPLANDVFGTPSTNGKSAGNAFPGMVNTRVKASCAELLTDIETVSLSSEEGVYTLSPLDSEEEEAYKYILALDEEANGIPKPDVTALLVNIGIEHLSHTPHHTHCICQRREQANLKNGNKRLSGHEETALPEVNGHTTIGDHQYEDTHHDSSTSVHSVECECGQNIAPDPANPRNTSSDTKECSNVHTDREEYMSLKREDALSCPSDSKMEESLFPESDSRPESHCSNEDTVDSQGSSHSNGIRSKDDVEDEDQTASGVGPHQIDTGSFNVKIEGESELTPPEAHGGSSIEVESLRETILARDTTSGTKECSNVLRTETEGEDILSITSEKVEESLSPDSDSCLELHDSTEVILDREEVSHGGAMKAKYDVERDQPANSIESHSVDNSKCNDGIDVESELTPQIQVNTLLEVESVRGTITAKDTTSCTTEYSNIHSNTDEEDISQRILKEGLCPESESGFELQDLTLDIIDPDYISQNCVVKAKFDVENDETANLIESHPPTDKGSMNYNTERDTELNPQTQGDNLPSEEEDGIEMIMERDTKSGTKEFSNEHTATEGDISVREDVSSSTLDIKLEESLFLDSDSGSEPQGSTTDTLDPDDVSHNDAITAKDDMENDQTANSVESHSIVNGRFNGTAERDIKLAPQTHRDSSSEEEAISTCNANSDQCSDAHSYREEAVSQRIEHVVSSPPDSEMEESMSLGSDPRDDVEGDRTADKMESYQMDNGPLNEYRPTEDTELPPQTQGVSSLEGEESLMQTDLCGKYSGQVPHAEIGCSVDREGEALREKDTCDISCLDGRLLQRDVLGRGAENQEEPERWYERSLLPDEDTAEMNAHPTRERALSSASVDYCGALDAKELNLLLYLWLFTYCFFVIRHGICKYFSDVLK